MPNEENHAGTGWEDEEVKKQRKEGREKDEKVEMGKIIEIEVTGIFCVGGKLTAQKDVTQIILPCLKKTKERFLSLIT